MGKDLIETAVYYGSESIRSVLVNILSEEELSLKESLTQKHYRRKHGANAYYGQN